MAQIITPENPLTLVRNGKWILPNYANDSVGLNKSALYVASFIGNGFKATPDGVNTYLDMWRNAFGFNRRKYDITDFVITSMYRPNDATASPHRKNLAVDFYVKPLSLMPQIFNDLAAMFNGGNIYIGAPISGGNVAKHIHFDFDVTNHKNYKAIEIEETARSGKLGEINAASALKVLNWYNAPVTAENIKSLLDNHQGGLVSISENSALLDAVMKVDATVNDGNFGKRLLGVAILAGVCFVGYKVLTSEKK